MDGSLSLVRLFGLRVLIDRPRQRGAKAGQMRSAVWIRDGVGEAKNLIVVAVVVLQNAIDKDLVASAAK